jgi:hypothetical protein
VRLEFDQQREHRQRQPAEREHHCDRRQYPHRALVPAQLPAHCEQTRNARGLINAITRLIYKYY